MNLIIDLLSIVFMALGVVFFLGSAVGVVRFPDFYTRMHAAGKGDTLSSLLLVGGIALHHVPEIGEAWGTPEAGAPWYLIAKLLAICLFIMFTSPSSTHALIDAGYKDGIRPAVSQDDLHASSRRS